MDSGVQNPPENPEPDPPPEARGPDRRSETEPPAVLPPNRAIPEGPCFLLMNRADKVPFGKANPFALRRALDQLVGPLETAKPIRSGALLLKTRHRAQTDTLLACTQMMDRAVAVTVADRLNAVEGVVRSEALTSLSNAELLRELAGQGVVRVQRLRSRNAEEWGPNPTIRMSFQGQFLPRGIRCVYLTIPVDPWVPRKPMCQHCWQSGHDTRRCHFRTPTCGRCSGSHPTDGCERPMKCPNCGPEGRGHRAWDRNCPFQRDLRAEHRDAQRNAREAHRRGVQNRGYTPMTYAEVVDHAVRRRAQRSQPRPQDRPRDREVTPEPERPETHMATTSAGASEASPGSEHTSKADSRHSTGSDGEDSSSKSDPRDSAESDGEEPRPSPRHSGSKIPVPLRPRPSSPATSDRSRRQPSRAAKSSRAGHS